MRKYKGSRSTKSPSRKRSLGEVKVNFNSLVKQEKQKFLKEWGAYMKEHYPDRYYSITGKPLPKKHQKKQQVQITPVNAYVPPQSKLSKEDLDILMKKEAEEKKSKRRKSF